MFYDMCRFYRVERDVLLSKDSSHPMAQMRFVIMRVLRERGGLTLSEIGDIMHRDHTTVLHGLRKASEFDMSDVWGWLDDKTKDP